MLKSVNIGRGTCIWSLENKQHECDDEDVWNEVIFVVAAAADFDEKTNQ